MRLTIRVFDVTLFDVTLSRGAETLADLWSADELLEDNDPAAIGVDDDEEG